MSEPAYGTGRHGSANRRWVTPALVLALVLVVAGSWWLASRGRAGFTGTDQLVTEQLERQGVRPWAAPVASPGSPEVESGLFALQAGIGGVLLGYAVGRLHARARAGHRG